MAQWEVRPGIFRYRLVDDVYTVVLEPKLGGPVFRVRRDSAYGARVRVRVHCIRRGLDMETETLIAKEIADAGVGS